MIFRGAIYLVNRGANSLSFSTIDENRRIFGFVNRIDFEKQSMVFDARLIVDNICVLAGKAHVTSVSETSVKIQLLGSAASYNYGNKMAETFIDELDMGEWFTSTWPDRSYWDGRLGKWVHYPDDVVFDGVNTIVFNRAAYNSSGNSSDQIQLDNILGGKLPWVAFPTVNASADFLCNGLHFRQRKDDQSKVGCFFRGYEGERQNHRSTDENITVSGAIQPFVWFMAQKVAEATGFDLQTEDNALYTNELFRRIFIVNTNNLILCNKCLPHWSVNEWWTQIENTFGVILSVDYDTLRISLRQRKDHYDKVAGTVHLNDVVDEFSAEVDDDTQADISANNVGYADFDCQRCERLSEFILKSADYNRDFDGIEDLNHWATVQGADEMAKKKSVIFECRDGRRFIYSEDDGLVEVDMYRPRIVDDKSEDIDIELKFVPAAYADSEAGIYRAAGIVPGSTPPPDVPVGSVPVTVLSAPGISDMAWYKDHVNTLDIEAVINEDQDEGSISEETPDLIYIAIFNKAQTVIHIDQTLSTGHHVDDKQPYPRPLLRERLTAKLGGVAVNPDAPQSESLSIIPIEGQNNLASNTVVGSVSIDTTVRHCISFIADRVPDPGSIFLIRNRRFVCEKIEADIAVSGLKKLMTGYFYEFKP